jgi:hypothetical protein
MSIRSDALKTIQQLNAGELLRNWLINLTPQKIVSDAVSKITEPIKNTSTNLLNNVTDTTKKAGDKIASGFSGLGSSVENLVAGKIPSIAPTTKTVYVPRVSKEFTGLSGFGSPETQAFVEFWKAPDITKLTPTVVTKYTEVPLPEIPDFQNIMSKFVTSSTQTTHYITERITSFEKIISEGSGGIITVPEENQLPLLMIAGIGIAGLYFMTKK